MTMTLSAEILQKPTIIDGKKWIPGAGNAPTDIMVILDRPDETAAQFNQILSSDYAKFFYTLANQHGLNLNNAYWTYAVKYLIPESQKSPSVKDIKTCLDFVHKEIELVNPKLIICLGTTALKSLLGVKEQLQTYRGGFTKFNNKNVFVTFSPGAILRAPHLLPDFKKDLQYLVNSINVFLKPDANNVFLQKEIKYTVYNSSKDILTFIQQELQKSTRMYVLDCEWHGKNWLDPERYVRTIQLGLDEQSAIIFELFGPNRTLLVDQFPIIMAAVKQLLEDPNTNLIGHNIIADGEWLLSFGIDIRNNVVYDTMLAEHTAINELGPFDLMSLALKYTNLGKYDLELAKWVKENPKLAEDGYGNVPREILLPYAAYDVVAPRIIMEAQYPYLVKFLDRRGLNQEYPSLWQTVLNTQRILYEIEITGLTVDHVRLRELTEIYTNKLKEEAQQLKQMLYELPIPEWAKISQEELQNYYTFIENFNYRSHQQVAKLLFKILNLTPIKTTSGKNWGNHILHQNEETQKRYNPATDSNTLDILSEKHPIVRQLSRVKRLQTICTTFLNTDEARGLAAQIWPDGKLHARFSQLSDTARLLTRNPNVQNFPKKAEGHMVAIFGEKDKVPPSIRTIIVPDPGYVLVEADFVQAELFVLAALSEDENMWAALTTPGMDLHDQTAITGFGLEVLLPDGSVADPDQLLKLAAVNYEAFEKLQAMLRYRDQRGHIMSRTEFKNTIRVSAKNINFGIPYGRGALDIARQVRGEAGVNKPIETLQAEIEAIMENWKTKLYPKAWNFMVECANAVINPGYLINPWGRYRRFPQTNDQDLIQSMKREAQNYPIQSTVADTCLIALGLMDEYRSKNNLHFKIINQIHDAIIVMSPVNEIEQTKRMFYETMGSVKIPLKNNKSLTLDIDVEVMNRWGEK